MSLGESKVGAVTTQNVTDPSIGNEVLDQMERGLSPKAIDSLEIRDNIEYRQVAAVTAMVKLLVLLARIFW